MAVATFRGAVVIVANCLSECCAFWFARSQSESGCVGPKSALARLVRHLLFFPGTFRKQAIRLGEIDSCQNVRGRIGIGTSPRSFAPVITPGSPRDWVARRPRLP